MMPCKGTMLDAFPHALLLLLVYVLFGHEVGEHGLTQGIANEQTAWAGAFAYAQGPSRRGAAERGTAGAAQPAAQA